VRRSSSGLITWPLAAPPIRPQNGVMSRPNLPPVIDLDAAFAAIDRPWTPHLAAEVNGHHVRLARLEGAFTWHAHEHEDELFLVVRGTLRIEFRDGDRTLGPGSMLLVPRGVEHRPVAEPTADVLLFEPGTTVSTGATDDPRRVVTPPPLAVPPPAT
jgi:mannose-6-phosphate isomerase-like protein (cupin superfamily)